jgi:hypothetical protein
VFAQAGAETVPPGLKFTVLATPRVTVLRGTLLILVVRVSHVAERWRVRGVAQE